MAKQSKFMRILNFVLNILLAVFLIGTGYMFLWRIFGNSPTDFEVISWTVGLFGVALFKLFTFVYAINREIGEVKTGVKTGFARVKEDIGFLKEDFSDLKKDVLFLKDDMHEIKSLIKKK